MGRTRRYGGADKRQNELSATSRVTYTPKLSPIPSAPLDPEPSAPLETEPALDRPETIATLTVRECGQFTDPIPGATSRLTWQELINLATTQFDTEELRDPSNLEPHAYYRSFVGSRDNQLWNTMRDATRITLTDEADEVQGLLLRWMDDRRELGLPDIDDPDGVVVTPERLTPLSCRLVIGDRLDAAELIGYRDKWRIFASFISQCPQIIRGVVAGELIPLAIAGGSHGGLPCLEGFCDYSCIALERCLRMCFPLAPTVIPPMPDEYKLTRGVRVASRYLERLPEASREGAFAIAPFADRINAELQRLYPGTDFPIGQILDQLRVVYSDAYMGGKTKRKRRIRKTNRRK